VTASHVLWDPSTGRRYSSNLTCITHEANYSPGNPEVTIATDLLKAQSSGNLKKHATRDVAVLRIWSEVTTNLFKILDHSQLSAAERRIQNINFANLSYASQFTNLSVGDDIYLVGFPNSLGLAPGHQIAAREPLLRRSIIASKNPSKKLLILDGPVYPGNSGGPVWVVQRLDLLTTSVSIAGVAVQLVPFDESRLGLNQPSGISNSTWAVSSYSVAEPIDFAIELIEGNEWR
jgi:hypothetical protein